MVREFTETSEQTKYRLELLQRLAADDAIIYASTQNILRNLDRLNFSHDDLRNCIGMLTNDDFRGSGRYQIDGSSPATYTHWMDVYRLRGLYCPYDDSDDGKQHVDLYIKLSLSANCVCVTVHSFHEWNRWI